MDGGELELSLGQHHCCLFLGSRTSSISAGLNNGFIILLHTCSKQIKQKKSNNWGEYQGCDRAVTEGAVKVQP
jgi:hypothetical protein